MTVFLDSHRKVIVSLGGRCPLGCKHCYTQTSQFVHGTDQKPADVIRELRTLDENTYDTICISGDTDIFVDETLGSEFLSQLATGFPQSTIMFTTRIVPSDHVLDALQMLATICRARRQLLIPCISVVTYNYPNSIELPSQVPPTATRLEFMRHLRASGLPCILTARPTFPFSVVPANEVSLIARHAHDCTTIALGEAFLFDADSQIERRLSIKLDDITATGRMTFLDQPAHWKKQIYPAEVDYARQVWSDYGKPYFLRSPTAIALLRQYWNHDIGQLTHIGEVSEPIGHYLLP